MSHVQHTVSPTVDANQEKLTYYYPTLSLLIAMLVPCVVLLFLLNCLIILHRVCVFKQNRRSKRMRQAQRAILQSGQPTNCRTNQSTEAFTCAYPTARVATGLTLPRVTVTQLPPRAGSDERPQCREVFHRPDGATGEEAGSFRPTSAARVSCIGRKQQLSTRSSFVPHSKLGPRSTGCSKATPMVTTSSSDSEFQPNRVPPNSPENTASAAVIPPVSFPHRTSTHTRVQNNNILFVSPLDSIHFEYASSIPNENTVIVNSASSFSEGPGLDSDFGASAGISLRILSSDSESFPNAAAAATARYSTNSGMEWDYYDPSFKRQHHLQTQSRQFPVICSKQYWI
ncbi:protein huluwa-like isoform X2 [Protopterus annectens]|uniref:protein huluwa-like isoform X2 n=1 Tax=Protopterus annectens TaxID=7888 RepID=UPI001CFA2033|nr:protein huluwa-like isoform X2 [Protopterus annectens]